MSKSTFSYEDAYGQVPAGSSLSSKQAGKFSYEDAFGSEPAPPASRGIKGTAQDVAATTVKAALAVPEAAVGVADLVTGGKAGKALEGVGVRFKEAREIAEGWHSDVTKAQKAEFQNAYGVAGKAAVALSNPSLIAMAVGESLGAMGAGGAIGRGAMAATRLGQVGGKGAAIAGAAGEGVVGAGSAAEQIRQETVDGELTAKQAALAAGTGLATGALGFAGNKVANRLGIGDADMMLAQGTKGMAKDAADRATAAAVNPLAQPAQKSILRQMGEGAITEGVLEELPQSVSEQILQNEALGKSWSEGLDDAIVMGILSGGTMGAGAAGYRGFKDKQIDDAAANARNAAANAPGAAPGQDQAAAAAAVSPAAWATSAGAAAEVEPGTAPASPANAPNLDYETLPGAAPEAQGNEIDFTRDFPAPEWGTELGAAGQQTASTAVPELTPSQAMGLDPNTGALSKAAAMAVDSGASPVVQPQVAPMEEQLTEQQAAPQVPAGVDPDTGEVSLQAQMDELKSRITFMQQQGAAQGWDGNRAAQRNALQTQLTRLELQAAGGQGRGASTAGAPAPVQLTGINQILSKQIPDMNEQELQQPFALAEQFNRRSTFIASYRIAKDQGMADPAAFARKAVLETQFVYSKANKPKWARGAVGGTLFTFKTYSVSYLELMQRMWNQGGPEGKRAVGWALAMLLLMSGAGGVPFMEDAEDLIDGAGQMMGCNISAKQWRKELLANVAGKELAEFMEQGLSGLPGAPIDVSGRLGMGNLLPGTGLFLDKPNRERDMTEIIGPAGDLVARGFSGARQVAKGVANWDASAVGRGVLEWAPTAVRNLAKGADMAATGMYRDTKGYKVIDTTLAEAAAKAIGFQPKSVAEVLEANSFIQRSKSFYTQTSSDIKAQWADALFRKDEAAVQRVRERLADWNRDNPEQPMVVKMPDVWKRVREMGKDRSDRIANTAPKALREQMRNFLAN